MSAKVWNAEMRLVPTSTDTLFAVDVPYKPSLNADLKSVGARWSPESRQWLIALDMCRHLRDIASWHGLTYNDSALPAASDVSQRLQHSVGSMGESGANLSLTAPNGELFHPNLLSYQREAVAWAFYRSGSIFAFDPGLGKTFTAIELMRLRGVQRALIVCPAITRYTWLEELARWWPEHPPVTVIDPAYVARAKRKKEPLPDGSDTGLIITSYPMLKYFKDLRHLNILVWDELHYLAKDTSKRGNTARLLAEHNPQAVSVGLTGTLIPNRVEQLHNPLSVIMPGCWGSWYSFVRRYCEILSDAYSDFVIGPLRHDRAAELHERVSAVARRVTMNEVAHLLPPFRLQMVPYTPDFKYLNVDWGDEAALTTFLREAGNSKISKICEMVDEAFATPIDRLCAVVYHKEVGRTLTYTLCDAGYTVYYVDGDLAQDVRKEVIAQAVEDTSGKVVLVVTMASIGIGINDLVHFSNVILGELYWQPALIIQLLGRFYRLSSKEPVLVRAPVLKGTIDEAVALSLRKKMDDINQIVRAGTLENELKSNVWREPTREEMVEQFQALADECVKGEYEL